MTNEYIVEAEDCIKWYQLKGIDAYRDGTDVFIKYEDETHILVSGSEITYRASLWNELEDNKNE